jgi:hypothetical protein
LQLLSIFFSSLLQNSIEILSTELSIDFLTSKCMIFLKICYFQLNVIVPCPYIWWFQSIRRFFLNIHVMILNWEIYSVWVDE